jgi:hypothetical protein
MMTTINANNAQLELGFTGDKLVKPPKNRIARANWWFTQMREAVGRAIDWSAAAEPRPEQIWMPGAHREVKV